MITRGLAMLRNIIKTDVANSHSLNFHFQENYGCLASFAALSIYFRKLIKITSAECQI